MADLGADIVAGTRPEERAEARADLGDRPLAPGRAPGADRDRRRDRLDRGHPSAHPAELVVESLDHRVRTMALGLRREEVNE